MSQNGDTPRVGHPWIRLAPALGAPSDGSEAGRFVWGRDADSRRDCRPAVRRFEGEVATRITEQCIACGLCEPECPNEAISEAGASYTINPELCTECVGFHDTEQCAAVCPVNVCVADPDRVEHEAVLFERALKLHPQHAGSLELTSRTSHFRRAEASKNAHG